MNRSLQARYTSSGDFPKGCCYVIYTRKVGFERKNRVTIELDEKGFVFLFDLIMSHFTKLNMLIDKRVYR